MTEVLGLGRRASPAPARAIAGHALSDDAARAIGVVGAALLLIGWADLTLLWLPPDFGRPDWEFGTVSAHFDGMPLGTVGIALLAIPAFSSARAWPGRVIGAWCALVAVACLGALVVFALDVPIALRTAGIPRPVLLEAVAKTTLFAVIYVAAYGWLARLSWRASRRAAETVA